MDIRFCSYCGKELTLIHKFCPYCGGQLKPIDPAKESTSANTTVDNNSDNPLLAGFLRVFNRLFRNGVETALAVVSGLVYLISFFALPWFLLGLKSSDKTYPVNFFGSFHIQQYRNETLSLFDGDRSPVPYIFMIFLLPTLILAILALIINKPAMGIITSVINILTLILYRVVVTDFWGTFFSYKVRMGSHKNPDCETYGFLGFYFCLICVATLLIISIVYLVKNKSYRKRRFFEIIQSHVKDEYAVVTKDSNLVDDLGMDNEELDMLAKDLFNEYGINLTIIDLLAVPDVAFLKRIII